MKEFKDVQEGDWIFTIRNGWEKCTGVCKTSFPIDTEDSTYTENGKENLCSKYPSAWTYNPFNESDVPPCDFNVGEVIMVAMNKGATYLPAVFVAMWGSNIETRNGIMWAYARKQTPQERGE